MSARSAKFRDRILTIESFTLHGVSRSQMGASGRPHWESLWGVLGPLSS